LVDTTAGRVLFSEIVPSEISFDMINKDMTKKELSKIIEFAFKRAGKRATVVFLDNLEKLGFHYATNSGISICMSDMHIPSMKAPMIHQASRKSWKSRNSMLKDSLPRRALQ